MDVDRQSVAIGNILHVQPWDVIINELSHEFDGNQVLFDEVCTRSRSQLGSGDPVVNARDYFDRLQNNMLKEDLLDFLISLMDLMQFHINMGADSVKDVLQRYKYQLEVYRKEVMEDEEEEETFVGREHYVKDIVDIFNTDRSDIIGVCICGMGGIGKTTLAYKVCRVMKKRWFIRKVDLREKNTLKDVLRSIILELEQHHMYQDGEQPLLLQEDEKELKTQLFEFIDNCIKKKTLVLMDNMDDILGDGHHGHNFKVLLFELMNKLTDQGGNCKLRFLFTSRQKLRAVTNIQKTGDSFSAGILEKELPKMEPREAVKLFNLCTRNKVGDDILAGKFVDACGYNPLAITTIGSTIRYGLVNILTMLENLKPRTRVGSATEVTGVTLCLSQSFNSLGVQLQSKLLQLSLFKTAPFDINAAASVLGEPLFIEVIIGKDTELDLVDLKSRHLVEVKYFSINEEAQKIVVYSLHPLVFHFLNNMHQSEKQVFDKDMEKAQKRFIEYFKVEASKISENIDVNCMKAQRSLAKSKVHVLNFYDLLMNADIKIDKLSSVLVQRRISELSDFIVDEDKIWLMIQKGARNALESKDFLAYVFWKTQEGNKLLCLDRNEWVKKSIDDIEKVLNDLPRDGFVFGAVRGQYFLLKGRYLLAENQFEEALKELKACTMHFREKQIKKDYWNLLAIAFNSMGCAHYGKNNCDTKKAIECYRLALEVVTKKCNHQGYWNVEVPNYLSNIGVCFLREGLDFEETEDADSAKTMYLEALKIFDEAARLETQMNIHKMDIYARTMLGRGETRAALGNFVKADEDVRAAMMLRRRILPPPHEKITISTHKMGEILYKKGVWLYSEGKKIDALNTMWEAVMHYEMVRDHIKNGGLSVTHKEYPKIKIYHHKSLVKTQEHQKLKQELKFYKDFEAGIFDKHIRKRRRLKEAVKKRYTQKELYALVNASTTMPRVKPNSNSSSSSSSDEDDYANWNDGGGDNETDLDESVIPQYQFSKQERVVNFDFILKNDGKSNFDEGDDTEESIKKLSEDLGVITTHDDVKKDVTSTVDDETQACSDSTRRGRGIRQMSSVEDEVFGHAKLVAQESVEESDDIRKIIDENVGAMKRRNYRTSTMQSESFETSFDSESSHTSNDLIDKTSKSDYLRKMHSMPEVDENDSSGQEEEEMDVSESSADLFPKKTTEEINPRVHLKPTLSEEIPSKLSKK